MSSTTKVSLAVLTALPAVYLGAMVTGNLNVSYRTVETLHLVAMLMTAVFAIIYVVDVRKNPRVHPEKRLLWGVLLVFGGFFAQIIYFAKYIATADPRQRQHHDV